MVKGNAHDETRSPPDLGLDLLPVSIFSFTDVKGLESCRDRHVYRCRRNVFTRTMAANSTIKCAFRVKREGSKSRLPSSESECILVWIGRWVRAQEPLRVEREWVNILLVAHDRPIPRCMPCRAIVIKRHNRLQTPNQK